MLFELQEENAYISR